MIVLQWMFWQLRLGGKWLVLRLHLCVLIEYCQRCGRRQPLVWRAKDDLWLAVMKQSGGVVCPECFDDLAAEQDIYLRWEPRFEFGNATRYKCERPRN